MSVPIPILMLFDGDCNFCSRSVMFVSRRTPDHLTFCAMQTQTGQRILKRLDLPLTEFESLVVVEDGKVFLKSEAIFCLARHMGPFWQFVTRQLSRLPNSLRDRIYDWIANHRFAFGGQRRQCFVPPPHIRRRFID